MSVTFTDVFHFTIIVTSITGACLVSATLDPNPKLFNNLSHVLSYLENKENTQSLIVREVLYNFEQMFMLGKEGVKSATDRFPFISIEGMDMSGSKTLSEKVVEEVGGILLSHPPSIFDKYEDILKNTSATNPFRFLMLYATAFSVCNTYVRTPVVVNKYFFDTTFNAILEEYHDNILAGVISLDVSEKIKWPQDLLKPDLRFYVTIDEKTHMRRSNIYVPNPKVNEARLIPGILSKLSDKPLILDGNKALRNVLTDILKVIRGKGLLKND